MHFDTQAFLSLSLSLSRCAKIIPQDRILVPNFTPATRRNILRDDDCKVFLSGRFPTRFVQGQPNKKT